MKTGAQLSQQEIEKYRIALKRRKAQEDETLQIRKEHAWSLARRASKLLKESFGATKVVVFGSLAHDYLFTLWSDVDLPLGASSRKTLSERSALCTIWTRKSG
jgi:predicted nucleotidyltransferase